MPNRLARRAEPLPSSAREQPGRLVSLGRRSVRARAHATTSPSSCRSATRRATGATSWSTSRSRTQGIAAVLNERFVSIKVDREERPDVDRVYMTFVQATTGSGGWPMSVWLTPDLRPFYGGTYFPPDAQWGGPGFVDVLVEIARAWRDERPRSCSPPTQIVARLAALTARGGEAAAGAPGEAALTTTLAAVQARVRPPARRLRRRAEVSASERAAVPVARARANRRRSGARDGAAHAAGDGAGRHARSHRRRLPSLFRGRRLARAALREDALRPGAAGAGVSGSGAGVGRSVLCPDRRGHAAIRRARHDRRRAAASIPPRTPTAFRRNETQAEDAKTRCTRWRAPSTSGRSPKCVRCSGRTASSFERRYGMLPDGNAPFDPQSEFTGKNLLYTARGIAEIASELQRTPEDVAEALTRARVTLFHARLKRPRPHLDDKVLTSWNGLMIAAFARASRVLASRARRGRPSADGISSRRRAASFLHDALWDGDSGNAAASVSQRRCGDRRLRGRLRVSDLRAARAVPGRGRSAWLEWALTLQRRQDELFWDAETAAGSARPAATRRCCCA